MVEDVRGFIHFHHEGGLALEQVVLRPHPGKDSVDQTDLRFFRGDKAAHLRHQSDQGHLAEVRGFSRHVGSREDQDLVLARIQKGIVGDEKLGGVHAFHQRVPAIPYAQAGVFPNVRPPVGVAVGGFGEGGQGVDLPDHPGHVLDPRSLGGHGFPQLLKQVQLQGLDFFLRAGDFRFVLLEFRGNEPLGIDEGLFPEVFRGHPVEMFFGDFEVVAVNFVESHFQNRDAGAFFFLGFEGGNPGFAVPTEPLQPVQLFVAPGFDERTVFEMERGVVDQGPIDPGANVFQGVPGLEVGGKNGFRTLLEQGQQGGEGFQGGSEGRQIPRTAGGQRNPAQQSFQIVDPVQVFPEIVAEEQVFFERLHPVQPFDDGVPVDQGVQNPVPDAPGAQGRLGQIQKVKQRILSNALAGLNQFQAFDRGRVEEHGVVDVESENGIDVFERRFLGVAEVSDEGSARRDGISQVFAPEPLQRVGFEVLDQGPVGFGVREGPVFPGVDKPIVLVREGVAPAVSSGGRFRHQDFLGRQFFQFVGQLRGGMLALNFGDFEHARRHVQGGQAHPRAPKMNGDEVMGALGVQQGIVEHRAGGDDPDDVAFHQPLGLPGIFHLLANGDFLSGLDQFGDVKVGGVMGDSAHGDGMGLVFVPRRQGDLQEAGSHLGVFVEHLVEIPHPEKKNGVGMLLLDALVLLHHRGIVFGNRLGGGRRSHGRGTSGFDFLKRRTNFFVRGPQMFRVHLDIGQDRHEIGVSGPPGNDVNVQVFVITRSRGLAQVEANVEPIGIDHLAQDGHACPGEVVDLEQFVLMKFGQAVHVPIRGHHHVTGVVRVNVHDHKTFGTLVQDEVFFILAGRGQGAEDALAALVELDVFHPPRGPNLLSRVFRSAHGGSLQ